MAQSRIREILSCLPKQSFWHWPPLPLLAASAAFAAEFEVKMLTKGAKGEMVFEPDVVRSAPGDTVHFVVVDGGTLTTPSLFAACCRTAPSPSEANPTKT